MDYAVPPGRTLREVIAGQNMSQKELAARADLTEQTIVRILKGEDDTHPGIDRTRRDAGMQ